PAQGDQHGRVFCRAHGLAGGHRRIVDSGDGDRDRRNVAVLLTVVGLVGEAVGAVEVRRRRVGEGTVRVQGEGERGGRGVLRAGDEDRRDRVLVRIRVVAENAGGGHGKRGVLIGAVRVVVRDGRIVEDTVDLDVV